MRVVELRDGLAAKQAAAQMLGRLKATRTWKLEYPGSSWEILYRGGSSAETSAEAITLQTNPGWRTEDPPTVRILHYRRISVLHYYMLKLAGG